MRKIMAVYLGMVSYVDHLFGLLMEALKETGHTDDTTVFFFSDHGDWAGDYGLVEKWPSGLDDCLTRIPMIVRKPGARNGRVVAEPFECFDIMPTTLEMAGIETAHVHFARSMLPQLEGACGDRDRAVFAEGGYDTHEPHCFEGKPRDGIAGDPASIYYPKGVQQQREPRTVSRSVMIRTLTHKLIRRPYGMHELYDYRSDPREERNVYDQSAYAAVQADLERRLLDWYIHTADSVPLEPDPRGWPAT
jgi:choline-sulfatase